MISQDHKLAFLNGAVDRPAVLAKLLRIYSVFYNYVSVGRDKKTPAMRLGLADAPLIARDFVFFA